MKNLIYLYSDSVDFISIILDNIYRRHYFNKNNLYIVHLKKNTYRRANSEAHKIFLKDIEYTKKQKEMLLSEDPTVVRMILTVLLKDKFNFETNTII